MTQNHAVKPVVLTPTYNNSATLLGILHRIEALGLPLMVVNDGSTDATAQLLETFAQAPRQVPVRVITHERNQGKAAAMQTGFRLARELGYTHAVTIDTDGQLDPEEIPALLAQAQENPEALILGVRDEKKADYPARSRFGRRFSNLLVRLESGATVADSQCGMRVYPLGFALAVKCRAQRFGYETEVITRAGWAGCPIVESPVTCVYLPPGRRVSHFRPGMDSLRALLMHGRLIGRALMPWPHAKWPEPRDATGWIPSWKKLAAWISPREAWRQLKEDEGGRTLFAAGLAVGAFVANLPAYGLQTVIGLYASRRLHVHPVPVILGTQLSMPPINVVLVLMAIYVGHYTLHGSVPAVSEWPGSWAEIWTAAPSLLLAWVVGSVVVGIASAIVVFFGALLVFRLMLRKRRPVAVEG